MSKLERRIYLSQLRELFETFPVVAILGPRQSGKSTLAHQYIAHNPVETHYFDLESEIDLARLQEAQLSLQGLSGLIVIDEIQRRPNLFPVLRYLVDTTDQKYLILGSASRDLIQQSSETLAGRIAYLELPPFGLHELQEELPRGPQELRTFELQKLQKLWWRGGYPRSYLATSDQASLRWRQEYIRTFLERDLAMLGFNLEPIMIRRFWQMLAHYHGQIFNASELAGSMGVGTREIGRYLDALEGTFMVRQLHPWFENLKKRQVKSPKTYIRDSGLLHVLLGLQDPFSLIAHPRLGASWEGFALEEIIKALQPEDCFFWATSNRAELDLLVFKNGRRLGFEFKYSSTPSTTKSMHIALQDLNLDELYVIVPQGEVFPLSPQIKAAGLWKYLHLCGDTRLS